MILTLGAVKQLVVVGSHLFGAAARAWDSKSAADLAEVIAKGLDAPGEFRRGSAPQEIAVIHRISRRQLKHIEDHCDRWLAGDLGADWRSRNPDASAALAALEHVLPACMPGADGFAQEDLSLNRIELEKAVAVALDAIARGERGTNLDEFVDDVLARIGEKTRVGDFDEAAHAVDQALIELDTNEAERDSFRRSRVTRLEAGVEQDILRRDPVAAAHRIEAIVATEMRHSGPQRAHIARIRSVCR